jgi:hypothetical protein
VVPVVDPVPDSVPVVPVVPLDGHAHPFYKDAESLRWWKSIGTLAAQQDMSAKLRMEQHDHWHLDNQLPLPQTIFGSKGDRDVVLVRLRALNGFLQVSADDTIEFALDSGRKHTRFETRSGTAKGYLLRLRVVEIYYGFTDYLSGITQGCAQQHSFSTKNAYAVCRILNIPAPVQDGY